MSDRGIYREFAVSPTVDTNIYANGDLFFDTTELFDWGPHQVAVIKSVEYHDKENQAAQFELMFTSASGSVGTINAAADVSATLVESIMAHVDVGGTGEYVDLGTTGLAEHAGFNRTILKSSGTSEKVYVFGVVSAGTPNYSAATSLSIHVMVELF